MYQNPTKQAFSGFQISLSRSQPSTYSSFPYPQPLAQFQISLHIVIIIIIIFLKVPDRKFADNYNLWFQFHIFTKFWLFHFLDYIQCSDPRKWH